MSFENLALDSRLLQAVKSCGFDQPTDIQKEAIPHILEGRNVMASAQTGTGKTAAFVLPALHRLLQKSNNNGVGPRVLILTPTRELAKQIEQNVKQFSKNSRVFLGSIVGGEPYPPQIRMLSRSLDILVATPGRLIDHLERGRLDMSRVECLVLDEADRMLDMGFVDEVKSIASKAPANKQTLLFSATFEGKVATVAKQLLKDPVRIQQVSKIKTNASITQRVHAADDLNHKHDLLAHLVSSDSMNQAVIFTATKRGADSLAKTLSSQGHKVSALHGDMTQHHRKRTIENMRRGKFRLLVATDVASRGLDIKGISHVINFDLPMVSEDYIHRIGRTGRGGATGDAISLVSGDDWSKLFSIEKMSGQKIDREHIPGLEATKPEPSPKNARPANKRNGKKRYGGYNKGGNGSGRNYRNGNASGRRQSAGGRNGGRSENRV